MRRNFAFLLGTVTGACLTFVVMAPQGANLVAAAKAAARSDAYTQLNLFGNVFERIKTSYVEKPDDSKLMEGAINGMISALDPHSRYMNEKGWSDMQETTHGEFGGLGIEVTMEDGLVKVVTPIDVAIVREIIRVRPVRYRTDGGDIGYIRITRFNEQTTEGLKKAIASITKEIPADKLAGYVVDLRNNPGGLLDQAVSVSSAFMNRGEVVSTRGRTAEETQRFTARGGDITKGKPLVVLINGGSASASEIVAGALRDHKRATLIGTRTFGKGSVQTIIPLGAGNGALALTTARYFTPSGRSIQAQGIAPDVEVLQDVPDELKNRAELKGEASMRGHLAADGAEQAGSQAWVPPNEKDDKALNAAFNLLRGVTVNANAPAAAKRAVPN